MPSRCRVSGIRFALVVDLSVGTMGGETPLENINSIMIFLSVEFGGRKGNSPRYRLIVSKNKIKMYEHTFKSNLRGCFLKLKEILNKPDGVICKNHEFF